MGQSKGEPLGEIRNSEPVSCRHSHDLVLPDVLADRHADAHAAEADRTRHRADVEHALLVEHAVVGQVDLEAHALHAAGIEQRRRVIELAVLGPDGADQHAGAAVGGVLGDGLDGRAGGRREGRLAHQVLGRIAGDEQLRQHDEVGALGSGLRTRLAQLLGVARKVADRRVELGEGDFERIGDCIRHGWTLGLAAGFVQRGRSWGRFPLPACEERAMGTMLRMR